jgi:hypothetical protein
MHAREANGEQEAAIRLCRACREVCDAELRQQSAQRELGPPRDTITCVAILSLIGDRLDRNEPCPYSLLEHAVELAEQLPEDGSACAAACRAAAEAISDLVEENHELGY